MITRFNIPLIWNKNLAFKVYNSIETIPLVLSVGNTFFDYIVFKTLSYINVVFLLISLLILFVPKNAIFKKIKSYADVKMPASNSEVKYNESN